MTRIALVTGANQGVGLQVVRELCKKFDGTVLLAARSLLRGEEARRTLEAEGLHPSLLELDVDSVESIRLATNTVREKYGRLDVLINNAGVLIRKESGKSFYETAVQTIQTNYYGVMNVTNAFSPLLQPNSRIINMSSILGKIFHISSRRQKEVLNPKLSVEMLSRLMDEFVSDAKNLEDYDTKGWVKQGAEGEDTCAAYSVSKIGVSRLTELQLESIGKDPSKPGMLINSVHPGWIKTRMGTERATSTVEEGADTAVYLALLPPGTLEPNGQFMVKREPVDWRRNQQLT